MSILDELKKQLEAEKEEEKEYNPFDPNTFGWCGVTSNIANDPGVVASGIDDISNRSGLTEYTKNADEGIDSGDPILDSEGNVIEEETAETSHKHSYLLLTDTDDTYDGFNKYFPKVDNDKLRFSKIEDDDLPSLLTRKTYRSNKKEAFTLKPFGAGTGETGELRFLELSINGLEYVGFKAPNSIASNCIWTIPSGDGTSGQAIITNGSKVLSFSTISGTTTFTGLTDTPASYSGEAGKFCLVNSGETAIEFISPTALSLGRGAILSTAIEFLDNFEDGSLYWAWRTDDTDANRTITEGSGVLTIAIANGIEGRWDATNNKAPKAMIGMPGFPCVITTKLNSFTVNDLTYAGLFIANDPTTTGTNTITWCRRRKDASSWNGLCVRHIGAAPVYTDAITTLPIWLRASITGHGVDGHKIIFSYSTDGLSYTDAYTKTDYPAFGAITGLFAANEDATYPAISAPFESFKMERDFGPG